MDYLTVTDVNLIVKDTLEGSGLLNFISVKGEISNLKYHSRGHVYFSLKDETSKINAVMFNSAGKLAFTPKDGDSVIVSGKINVYPASGSYQIMAFDIKPDGVGNLYILFEELKKKLSNEGLFDTIHKKRIPRFPERIGVITAREGAAVRDIISTINRRYPLCEIYLFPSLVQGEGAKESIVKMIRRANETDIDVLIVGRGGGSIEDLWAFNEESVARAIYESKVPVVSAVGHEIDYTIADFVADMRAPTPTAAAEMVVKDIEDIESYLSEAVNRMNSSLTSKINHSKEKLNKYESNYIINNPINMIEVKRKELNEIKSKLEHVINSKIIYQVNIFERYKLKLELLNPTNILEKGYSIVKVDGKICKSTDNINIGDNIDITLSKGCINATVKGVNNG